MNDAYVCGPHFFLVKNISNQLSLSNIHYHIRKQRKIKIELV